MKVGHVPEDRHRDGLVLDMMISENIALQTYYKEPLSKNGIFELSKYYLLCQEVDGRV